MSIDWEKAFDKIQNEFIIKTVKNTITLKWKGACVKNL